MKKTPFISIFITVLTFQAFSAEFILGGKLLSKRDSAQTDTTTDSTALVRDTSFYLDSAEVAELKGIRGQTMTGQRSRASITRGIDQNATSVRKEYRDYVRSGKKISGGVIVRFKVIPNGDVVECKIVETSVDDIVFEKKVVTTVKMWKFPVVQLENDTTIVEYPFVFEQIN